MALQNVFGDLALDSSVQQIVDELTGQVSAYDNGNIRTTPMAANEVFTGAWKRIDHAGSIAVLWAVLATDGQPSSVQIEFSDDGTNPVTTPGSPQTITVKAVDAAPGVSYNVWLSIENGSYPGKYYRVKVTQSATASLFGAPLSFAGVNKYPFGGSFTYLDAPLSLISQALLTRAVLAGTLPDGSFANAQLTSSKSLQVSVENSVATASGSLFVEHMRDDIAVDFSDPTSLAKIKADPTSTGTVTLDAVNGQAVFATGATPGANVLYRSVKRAVYEPAHAIRGEQTIVVSRALVGDEVVSWGFSDGNNSVAWRLTASGLTVIRRKNGVIEESAVQSAWNRDKADGSQYSQFRRAGTPEALSVLKNNLYEQSYEWLGAAPLQFVVKSPSDARVTVHEIEYPNAHTGASISTPALPLFVYAKNDSVLGGDLQVRCGSWRAGIMTGKVVGTALSPDGDYADIRAQGTDTPNCSTTALDANGVFRGIWFPWQSSYVKAIIDLAADVPGTLYIDFSESVAPVNGNESSVNDSVVLAYDPAVTPLLKRQTPIQSKWYRTRYVNGIAAQSVFSLDSALVTSDPGLATQSLSILPRKLSQVGLVRAVPALPTPDGTGYQEVPVDPTNGHPYSHISKVDDDLLLRGLTTAQVRQFVLGTTPLQLDASKLAGRRFAEIINLDESATPVTAWIGHSAMITSDAATWPVYGKASRGGAYGTNVDLWGVVKDTGGVQTVYQRSGSATTGSTATNPGNALASDNAYATCTQGQLVDVSGFSAGTTNQLISVKVCAEMSKQSGQTEQALWQESFTGSAAAVGTVSTSGNVTATALATYLCWVARSGTGTVTSVTGLGLTWTQVRTQSSDDSNRTLDLWIATGSPTTSGVVSATLSAAATQSKIVVSRYSGVSLSSPVQASGGGAANSSTVTVPGIAGTNKGIAVLGIAENNATFTPGAGYTERAEITGTEGLATETKALTATATETPTGSLSGAKHYAAIDVTLTPAAAYDPVATISYKRAGVAGATSGQFVISATADLTSKLDVTADHSWVAADIPGVDAIVTATSVSGAVLQIDQVYLEITDTTANVVRVALREIA